MRREWHAETALRDGDKAIERSNFQLPTWPRVIYCNFNQQYKVDAPTLRAWVQILEQVPDSVLWLLRFGTSDAAEVTIVKEAEKLGLKSANERIVFTDPVPRRIHLHVKTLAHIFIDTPQYNGWSKIFPPTLLGFATLCPEETFVRLFDQGTGQQQMPCGPRFLSSLSRCGKWPLELLHLLRRPRVQALVGVGGGGAGQPSFGTSKTTCRWAQKVKKIC